jgi:hypothetical protein
MDEAALRDRESTVYARDEQDPDDTAVDPGAPMDRYREGGIHRTDDMAGDVAPSRWLASPEVVEIPGGLREWKSP